MAVGPANHRSWVYQYKTLIHVLTSGRQPFLKSQLLGTTEPNSVLCLVLVLTESDLIV